jgi:hypothetical protein
MRMTNLPRSQAARRRRRMMDANRRVERRKIMIVTGARDNVSVYQSDIFYETHSYRLSVLA